MRAPTIIFGRYRIRYRQVTHIKRYFFVDFLDEWGGWWKDIVRLSEYIKNEELLQWFKFLTTEKDLKRFDIFMDKVRKYDNYLDQC